MQCTTRSLILLATMPKTAEQIYSEQRKHPSSQVTWRLFGLARAISPLLLLPKHCSERVVCWNPTNKCARASNSATVAVVASLRIVTTCSAIELRVFISCRVWRIYGKFKFCVRCHPLHPHTHTIIPRYSLFSLTT